jgi:hypothetical protein
MQLAGVAGRYGPLAPLLWLLVEIGVPGHPPETGPGTPLAARRRSAFSFQVTEAEERQLDQFVRVRLSDARVATDVRQRRPISVHIRCGARQVAAPRVRPAKAVVGPDGETMRVMGQRSASHRCPDPHAEHEDWSGEEEQREEQVCYSGYQDPSFCVIDKTRLLSRCYIPIAPSLAAIPNKSLKTDVSGPPTLCQRPVLRPRPIFCNVLLRPLVLSLEIRSSNVIQR